MATSLEKRYSIVKKSLDIPSWFQDTPNALKSEIYKKFGSEKSIPEEIFLMHGKDLTKTITIPTEFLNWVINFFKSQGIDIQASWLLDASDNSKKIAQIQQTLSNMKGGYDSANEALKMAEKYPDMKKNKKFMKMQKATIAEYEAVEKQLATLVGANPDEHIPLSPNGFLQAFVALVKKLNVEIPEKVENHVDNAKKWKGKIEGCYKGYTLEHPEKIYEEVLAGKQVGFTLEQFVKACKA